jgi:hypothetical protein
LRTLSVPKRKHDRVRETAAVIVPDSG